MTEKAIIKAEFELVIWKSQFTDPRFLFATHFKQFFVKFVNQNFPSVIIFSFRETKKSLFTLLAQQFAYVLLRKC